jgi:alpha-1,2-mannosyltransferase
MSPCDVFVDTMGVGFSYPLVWLFYGVKIYSYTHYPFISRDMIMTVANGKAQYNNLNADTNFKRAIKLVYYWSIYYFYKFCGKFADEVAANSTWTREHMDELWNKKHKIQTIYPPCDTSDFINRISLDNSKRSNMMISFAQFRPEKQHSLQLKIWKRVLESPNCPKDAKFVMIGTCRGPDDEKIVSDLKSQALKLGIIDKIGFEINQSRDRLFEIF